MPAFVEWIPDIVRTGIIRCGTECHKFLDPYEFAFVLTMEGKHAHMKAGCGKLKPEWRKDVLEALASEGVETVTWERVRKDGSVHLVGPIKLNK